MHGFTKALALETARHGVTVNTVSPGYLRHQDGGARCRQEIMESKICRRFRWAAGRAGRSGGAGGLPVRKRRRFVTGANIAINGGQHMC
jgi:acetoacetyl-CoA reductase